MSARILRSILALTGLLLASGLFISAPAAEGRPVVVEIRLDMMVHRVSAEYVVHGIRLANQKNANAVLLELSTPGGLDSAMREIIQAILESRVPVITYVAPAGARAASAGFFILESGDIAVMAPGTNAGAAHPVVLGGAHLDKVMETKIENDAAAYMRSIVDKRGRNAKLAEQTVLKSSSFTDKEALEGHLIDAIASSPQQIFAQYNGKTIERFNDTTTKLDLANAAIEPYNMSKFETFLAWAANPNIAFILGAIGVGCLYIEFTHPGMIFPGVIGAVSLVMALYAFNLLPINYVGVILILIALVLFVLEANITSHGLLAAGGIAALVFGALILIRSPWPEARIHLSTALSVALPLGIIVVILVRYAIAAKLRKAVTGEEGMIGSVGIAQSNLELVGKVLVHGELWQARATQNIPRGSRVRVRELDGFTLIVESADEPR